MERRADIQFLQCSIKVSRCCRKDCYYFHSPIGLRRTLLRPHNNIIELL